MPLTTRTYLVGVCDDCELDSPQWGLHVNAPRVFTTAAEAHHWLDHQRWTVADRHTWCPRCTCRRAGHDLTRMRRGRQSCRRCGTAWHTTTVLEADS